MKRNYMLFVAGALLFIAACVKKGPQPAIPVMPELPPVNGGNASAVLTVDCAVPQGPVMRIEQANVHSTTSALPGDKSKTWLQALHHKTIRTWLALRTIYNQGYNYALSSGVPAETSMNFYSSCADSLLIALTAYNPTASQPLPGNGKGPVFQNFIKQTLIYYKTKYPKIKYIQAGNEPDYNGENVADYYEVYKDYYKAVNAANAELGLAGSNRILLSNAAFTSVTNFGALVTYADAFFGLYAADTDPEKRLDFFSMHCYTDQANPKVFETARPQIIAAMSSKGLGAVPVFVTEYGLSGGDFLPAAWTRAQLMTAWAPAQLARAFYLYEGGVDRVFNWAIAHGEIRHKSELADLNNAYPNPYGYALMLAGEVSARGTRVKAVSSKLSDKGLGINALAAMGNDKGIAVLVWNFNYTNFTPNQEISVQISNIPQTAFVNNKIKARVYMIDSKNNNIEINPAQNALQYLSEKEYDYTASLSVPLQLEGNSVALIVLNP